MDDGTITIRPALDLEEPNSYTKKGLTTWTLDFRDEFENVKKNMNF